MKQSDLQRKPKENDLKKYFDLIRNENYEDTFPSTAGWLRSAGVNSIIKNTERKKFNMNKFFAVNKFRLAYTFLFLAVFIAACNYPVVQEESVGDIISWSVSRANTDAIQKTGNLEWFKNGGVSLKETDINGSASSEYSYFVSRENNGKINEIISQLKDINGIENIRVVSLNESVKRPVYAALLNDVFKININATNKSDSEVAEEINAQLKNAGFEDAQVTFKKDADGKRLIRLVIPVENIKKDGGFDITVKDGENVNRIKELRRTGPGTSGEMFKGKSDQEIRDLVRKDTGNPDLKDEEIEIKRDGEKVMVKVNTKKEERGIQNETEDILK